MTESDFEGTLVLEKLATIGKVEDFFEAIDSDDIKLAVRIMNNANIDQDMIDAVLIEWVQAAD